MQYPSKIQTVIFGFILLVSIVTGLIAYKAGTTLLKNEKAQASKAILGLSGAFVETYAQYLALYLPEEAPVPASYRAKVNHTFNQKSQSSQKDQISISMVGIPGKEIKTRAYDQALEIQLKNLDSMDSYSANSDFITKGNHTFFRSVFPSIATNVSCVSCHNDHQGPSAKWKLNDLMGAMVIDQPIEKPLRTLKIFSVLMGFIAGIIGLLIYRSIPGSRRSASTPEPSTSTVQ